MGRFYLPYTKKPTGLCPRWAFSFCVLNFTGASCAIQRRHGQALTCGRRFFSPTGGLVGPLGVVPGYLVLHVDNGSGHIVGHIHPAGRLCGRPAKDLAHLCKEQRALLRGQIYRLSIEIDRKYFKKTTTQNLDVELDVLRGMVRLAASKKLHGGKYPPPLTMHQYEVWAKYNEEIGKLLGGYIKTL